MGNPEGAEAKLASEEAARTSPSWGVSHEAQKGIGSEIRNLPDNLILTKTRFLNNICRVCATYHEKGPMMLPLFYYDKGTRPLAKLVHTLLSVKVVPKDGLPKNACRECACKLFEWSAMRDKAADAQKLLHSQTELLIEDPHHHIYRSVKADADLGPPAADPQRPEASPRAEVPARKRRRFGCPTCGRVFTDAANLARHVRALHAARRPHACAECGRAFTRAEHLRAHALRHSAPAPLLCEACGARCASAAALRSHRRTHAAACHACACGARFRRAGELRAHASVHGGARPHACGCGRAFRLRAQLNMHARRHAAAAAGEDDDPAPDHCADFTRPRQPNVPMIRDPFIDNLDFDRIARDVADM